MTKPIILSTWSFGQRANAAGWDTLQSGGSSLDAVEQACCVIEADPEVDSVGLGGLPDASGRMSLDASIMLAPNRCGSVCMVRRHLHVTTLARAVMERTPHVMLAGEDADAFADEIGMAEQNLLTDRARAAYEQWRASGARPEIQRPIDRGTGELFLEPSHHDTVGVLALDAHGVLAGACTTSGMMYKKPGRVSDSCIIGGGLYVDPDAGAAVATGLGELAIGTCCSFLAVERMRAGEPPVQALRTALQRIIDTHELGPQDQVAMIAICPEGSWASAAIRPDYRTAVRTVDRDEIVRPDLVLMKNG